MPRHSLRFTLAGLALVATAACADRPTTPVAPAEPALALDARAPGPSVWAATYEGVTGEGALYALYMPKDWNHEVIYYAHGIVSPLDPVTLPSSSDNFDVVRDMFGALHYAVAYSSYSENGYAFKDALTRTHQLRGLFMSKFGKPQRSWLFGHSLGGQAVLAIAESEGKQYDGAYVVCADVGGTTMEIDYIANFRVLFDYFYPGVLPGNAIEIPSNVTPEQGVNAGMAAVAADPTGLGAILQIDQGKLVYTNQLELVTTLYYVFNYAMFANDFTGRTHGHSPFDNSHTVYTSSTLPAPLMAAVNAGVERYTAPPDAQAWLDHNYQPTGQLEIPTVTLHNERDPLIPFAHELAYHDIVANAGRLGMLHQHALPIFGHCNTMPPETVIGEFQKLVQWVKNGVPPT